MDRHLALAITVGALAVAAVLTTMVFVSEESALIVAAVALATLLVLIRTGVIQLDPVDDHSSDDDELILPLGDTLSTPEALPTWEGLASAAETEPPPLEAPAPPTAEPTEGPGPLPGVAGTVPAAAAQPPSGPPLLFSADDADTEATGQQVTTTAPPIDETVTSDEDIIAASRATELQIEAQSGGDSELARLLAKVQSRLADYD